MSDEHLRELERRWQESGAKPDWEAYVREQLRTGTGIVAEAAGFLEELQAFAGSIPNPADRVAALAEVAWALVPLGRDAWALEIVKSVEELCASPPDPQSAPILILCTARIRCAAVGGRVGLPSEALQALESELDRLSGELKGQLYSQAGVDARKAFAQWWIGLADSTVEEP